jgi:hypothetical protein
MNDDAYFRESEHTAFVNLIRDPSTDTHISPEGESEPAPTRTLPVDAWMDNAERIYSSSRQIAILLQKNRSSYTHRDIFMEAEAEAGPALAMSDDDVTIFESSIASFMTSTASQIDTLRQSNDEATAIASEEMRMHRVGIVSHLMSELRQIMDEFQSMQSIRNRTELDLYRDPLKSSYYSGNTMDLNNEMNSSVSIHGIGNETDIGTGNRTGNEFELDDEYLDMLERDEEEFQAFHEMEDGDEVLEKILAEPLPVSIPSKREVPLEVPQEVSSSPQEMHIPMQASQLPSQMEMVSETKKLTERNRNVSLPQHSNTPPMKTRGISLPPESETLQNQAEILQQEQVFLTAKAQNTKLDAAHKVESQMMQVTSLLSQFSSLITEQQEEIQVIADSTVKSRQNVDKGREQLVQATEQRKRSRHYFAWIIFSMGFLLLFMNAVIA